MSTQLLQLKVEPSDSESTRLAGFEAHFSIILSSLLQFFLCVNQTELCIIDTDTHWHADSGIMVTQESIWPVTFCISRRKQVWPECSYNKLIFYRDLDCLPLATEMDFSVLWCPRALGHCASRKHQLGTGASESISLRKTLRAVWNILSISWPIRLYILQS